MTKRKDDKNRVLKEGESQRPNGTYCYRYRDELSKRHAVYAKTLEELRKKEDGIQKDKLDGIHTDTSSVNDLFKAWADTKRNVRSSTLNHYREIYARYIEKPLGRVKVCDVKKIEIVRLLQKLMDGGLQYSTVSLIYVVLKQVFDLAVDNAIVRVNPTNRALVNLEKQKSPKQKALTVEEQKELEWYLDDDPLSKRDAPLIETMLWTGLRIGEAAALTWHDVDFENNTIAVNKTLVYAHYGNKGRHEIHDPKTETGRRTIPMLPKVREVLMCEKQRQTEEKLTSDVVVDGVTDFIFFRKQGLILKPATFNSAIARIIERHNREYGDSRVELPRFHNHTLRHTFATRMLEAGVSPKVMQTVLGHANISITMDTYVDVSNELVEDQLKLLAPCKA